MKIKVHRDCFIGGSFHSAGSVIEHDGPLSKWMEPVDVQPSSEEVKPRRRKESKDEYVI